MVAAATNNVQTNRAHPVHCRRCGQLLTADQSIEAQIGPDCAAIEASGAVPVGREWKLEVGDWVTWEGRTGEIVGYDGWTWGHVRVDFYDERGKPVGIVSVSKRWLTFVGTSMPDALTRVGGNARATT